MAKAGNKKVSSKVKRVKNPRKILKAHCYTAIAKPLNGSFPSSNASHFLKLYSIPYTYKHGKQEKTAYQETYLIKGLRGAIRHSAMKIMQESGIEVCHNSDKETDKEGRRLLPDGFHLLGSCVGNGECLIHQIFGSKGHEGLISVYADPIGSVSQKSAKFDTTIQPIHLAFENRVNISFEGKSIQDFKERYFSGYFSFEIDVSRCDQLQLGFLVQCILELEKLGRGYNTGYGRLEVREFELLKQEVHKKAKWNDNRFKVIQDIKEKPLKEEVESALQEWENYESRS
ncbi:MAG: RAMP superfamily CRISPR-associated protein [Candidatus Heimdallarchaeota archaeon]